MPTGFRLVAAQGFALHVRFFPGGTDIQASVGAGLLAPTLMYVLCSVMLVGAEVNDVIARRAGVVQLEADGAERAGRARWQSRRMQRSVRRPGISPP